MADARNDASAPVQNAMDSSTAEIKVFLGSEVEGGQEVTINRSDLAGLSPFFKSMLTHDMAERNQGRVRLQHVSVATWNVITAFSFSDETLVTLDNVQDVVCVADMYELTDLKDYCDEFLSSNADKFEDVLEVLNMASVFRLKKLQARILRAVRKDFVRYGHTDSFLTLHKEVLLEILCGPYIVGSEMDVCQAVMKWLQANKAERDTVEQMFQHLRLNELCLSCLDKNARDNQSAEVREVALQLAKTEEDETSRQSTEKLPVQYFVQASRVHRVTHCFPDKEGNPFGRSSCCECRQTSDNDVSGDVIILQGSGYHGLITNTAMTTMRRSPEFVRFSLTACFFRGCFVVSGTIRDPPTAFYNMKTRTWTRGSPLQQKRMSHALVSTEDAMYVVMGSGPHGRLSCIERYSSEERKWRQVGNMPRASTFVSAAVARNLIIATGRADEGKVLQTFNTETTEASVLACTPGNFIQDQCYSSGDRGVVFACEGAVRFVHFKESGEVTFVDRRLPDFTEVFASDPLFSLDAENDAEHKGRATAKAKQVAAKTPPAEAYFVQWNLDGGRANLTRMPSWIEETVTRIIRT